jgi:hypothetical protein
MASSTTKEVLMARKMATKKQVFDLIKSNSMAIVDAIGLGPLNVQYILPFDKKVSIVIQVRPGFEDKIPKEIVVNIDGEELGIDFEISEWSSFTPLKRDTLKIPNRIMRRVRELANEKKQGERSRKKAELAEAKLSKELKDLKESRKKELLLYATQIAGWIEQLFQSKDGIKFFRAVDRIRIFTARFWKMYPLSETTVSESATIEIDSTGKVTYSERSRALPSHDTPLGNNPLNKSELINKLHPDFLKQWAEHLTSGAVWDYIEAAMPKKY